MSAFDAHIAHINDLKFDFHLQANKIQWHRCPSGVSSTSWVCKWLNSFIACRAASVEFMPLRRNDLHFKCAVRRFSIACDCLNNYTNWIIQPQRPCGDTDLKLKSVSFNEPTSRVYFVQHFCSPFQLNVSTKTMNSARNCNAAGEIHFKASYTICIIFTFFRRHIFSFFLVMDWKFCNSLVYYSKSLE